MRKIIHIDMDYFYAQVEEKENPELADKPVAIGGSDQKRGVLSTCNYIARSYGIHSAMPTAIAIRKCPELIVLPPSMAKYKHVSQQIRDVFYSVTSLVEPLSLDEAYLDVTEVKAHSNSATLIAKSIKAEILLKTGLTGSELLSNLVYGLSGILFILFYFVYFMLRDPINKFNHINHLSQSLMAS